MRMSIIVALAMSMGLPSAAFAQAQCSSLVSGGACTCAKPFVPDIPVAELSNVAGGVQVTGREGLTPTTSLTQLYVGDRVVIRNGGSASFYFGSSCSGPLAPNTSVSLSAVGSCACIKVEQPRAAIRTAPANATPVAVPPPATSTTTGSSSAAGIATALAAVGVVGGGVAGALFLIGGGGGDDEEPVSAE